MQFCSKLKLVTLCLLAVALGGCISKKQPDEFRYRDLVRRNTSMRDIVFTAGEYQKLMEERRKAFEAYHGNSSSIDAFRFRKGTRIEIEVLGFPEFTKTVQVNPDGRFDYYGEIINVPALNKTIDELRVYLSEQLRQYVRDPKVVLNLSEAVDSLVAGPSYLGNVAVVGSVNDVGLYPYTGDDTVFDLIHRAGGLEQEGEWSDVAIIRRDSEFGHAIVILVDAVAFYRALRPDFMMEDVQLQPRDIVFVPKNLTPYEHFERDLSTFVRLTNNIQSLNNFDQLIEREIIDDRAD